MEYQGIEIENAKDRDILILSNLSDVQMMISFGQFPEANDRLNSIKDMMIKTSELIAQKVLGKSECGGTDRFTGHDDKFSCCNE